MESSYRTVQKSASDSFTVNKSRFIGYACPCETEEEALSFLKTIREKHKDASHNCYAYIIGENAGIMRYSDDGEPGGTAGLPMMDVLKGMALRNVCAVVTRYFGGVLLGTGGLTRAYTQGCKIAVEASGIVRMEKSERYIIDVGYPLWDKVNYALKNMTQITESTSFSASVEVTVLLKAQDAETVLRKLTTVTDGKIEYLKTDDLYYPWPENAD